MPTVIDSSRFYVYEHWRSDKNLCFYVGKGHGERAWAFQRGRNQRYKNIIAALARRGFRVIVKVIEADLSEDDAFALEVARIGFWRSRGVDLANMTDGGEGISGYKHREDTRATIKLKRASQKIRHSEATRAKIGAANSIVLKGRKNPEHGLRMTGRKQSAITRARRSASMLGHAVSEETRHKIILANLGQKRSPETCAKMSRGHLGKRPSPMTLQNMRKGQLNRWSRPCVKLRASIVMKNLWRLSSYREKVIAGRVGNPKVRAAALAGAMARWGAKGEQSFPR
jgi:hypothetical protein